MDKLFRQMDACFKDIKTFLGEKYDTLNDRTYEVRYSKFENKFWGAYTNYFFFAVTGEPDFHDFYERLEVRVNDRPIAWDDNGFIPDRIGDVIWNGENLKEQVAEVKKLYAECKLLEEDYLRNRSRDPLKRSKRVKKRPNKRK